MKIKQHERFQKIFYESFFLLNIVNNNHNVIFKVSGSTSNVYSVRINKTFEWNNIFCDCLDSKKWANMHEVVCKHCVFIIFKVLKLFPFKNSLSNITTNEKGEDFFEKRKLNKDYIEAINVFLDIFNLNDNLGADFIRSDYVQKYNQIKELETHKDNKKDTLELELKSDPVDHCIVCFDDFEKDTMLSREHNSQCLVCKNIFHKECLNKWFVYNKSCPYCRSPSTQNTDSNTNQYINLF
jgi:hypothetical protein